MTFRRFNLGNMMLVMWGMAHLRRSVGQDLVLMSSLGALRIHEPCNIGEPWSRYLPAGRLIEVLFSRKYTQAALLLVIAPRRVKCP